MYMYHHIVVDHMSLCTSIFTFVVGGRTHLLSLPSSIHADIKGEIVYPLHWANGAIFAKR